MGDRSRRAMLTGLLAAAPAATLAAVPWQVPTDAAIKALLRHRIDDQRCGVGAVVGVIDRRGRRIVSHGAFGRRDPRPVGHDTIFEIGSMTKVFTSLLLTDAVRRGEVALDDPVAAHLPAGVRVPSRGGREITLADLATHTSGLPRMPTNFAPRDPANPFADYTAERLYAFLNTAVLTRDIGTSYAYSNVGAGLLGHALSRRAGLAYGALVQRRITGPLGLPDTTIGLTAAQHRRLATGHDALLRPVKNWNLDVLAGAGALRSTVDDVLTFLAAELGLVATALKPAMDDQFAVRRRIGPGQQVALGWHIDGRTPWHDGATGGYRTAMGFDPVARFGVVVMTNADTNPASNDIANHLLTGAPLRQPDASLPDLLRRLRLP